MSPACQLLVPAFRVSVNPSATCRATIVAATSAGTCLAPRWCSPAPATSRSSVTNSRLRCRTWFPIKADVVVVASGFVEIVLGLALLLLGRRRVRRRLGRRRILRRDLSGNIAQWAEGNDAFGLDTGAKRFTRLFFQPLLVVWALWSTGAWRAWRASRAAPQRPSAAGRRRSAGGCRVGGRRDSDGFRASSSRRLVRRSARRRRPPRRHRRRGGWRRTRRSGARQLGVGAERRQAEHLVVAAFDCRRTCLGRLRLQLAPLDDRAGTSAPAPGRRGCGGRPGAPHARATPSPARRPDTAGRAARGRSRGRRRCRPARPDAARLRCRRTRRPRSGRDAVSPVTNTAGRLAAASSSSRSRVTPGRRLAKRPAPQARHTGGRSVAHRGHTSRPVVGQHDRRFAALAARQRAALPTRQQARPLGGVADAHDGPRFVAQMGDQLRRQQRPLPRLLAGAVDHVDDRPSVAFAVVGWTRQLAPTRAPSASGTATPAAPERRARRQRSITTSRACHVGEPSS